MTTLTVDRRHGYYGMVRQLKVLVDGATVARIRGGERARVRLPPGEHEVRVKMDWAKSPPVMVIATDDDSDVVELEAVSSELAGVLYTFFRPSKVWQLHRRGTTPG